MKLQEYLDPTKLQQAIADGYINSRKHPTLPLSILNYTASAQFDQHWPHEVCACRGLIVDGESNIISRPQYKFFNLGQPSTVITGRETWGFQLPSVEEDVMVDSDYIANLIQIHRKPLTITRKMDGQMGILWNYKDEWGIATRGSFESEGAKFATEKKWQKFVKYGAAKDFVPEGWTLIFEIIAKHLRIVIPYEWEGLCLLTAVNNDTGEEMTYEQLHELWVNLNSYSKTLDAEGNSIPGKPWCRLVEKFDIDLKTAENDQSMEEEGYVAAMNRCGLPPVKVKIKLAEYKRIHRTLSYVTPQMIWAEIAKPMDEWLAVESKTDRKTGETVHSLQLPAEFANWVKQWQRGLTKAFHENLVKAIMACEELRARDDNNEQAALLSKSFVPFKNDAERKKWLSQSGYVRDVVEAAMLLYKDRVAEAYENLWKLVRPHGRDDRFYVEGKGE
jgi:RNA ligase